MKAFTALVLLMAGAAASADVDYDSRRGVVVAGAGDDWRLTVGGRLHLDLADFDPDLTPLKDDHDVRRARVDVALRLGDDWQVRADYDVAGTVDGWKSLFLQYRGLRRTAITIGNQVPPFGLDQMTGSNDTTFMERSLPGALGPSLLLGAGFNTWGRGWTLAGGLYGDEIESQERRLSDGEGAVLRYTVAPVRKRGRVLHFGVATEYRRPDGRDEVRYRARPESYVTDRRLVDTRTITGIDDTLAFDLELGAIAGPFSLRGDYVFTDVARRTGTDLSFSGGQVTASWVVTGESLRYRRKTGSFGGIRPRNRWGAVELATRYSTLDLDDRDVTGGEQQNLAFGVNWYINRNFRVMGNYILVYAEPNRDGADEHPHILQFRFQAAL